ncbi:MAG: tetratricopeptide repeat protein [Gammaproteobacteria bacterium]|jgi:tetratricopeptide (TPR) repeat protein|nr:tetratricopeptide repeat protein [Gammaproteobacteria bacterium]
MSELPEITKVVSRPGAKRSLSIPILFIVVLLIAICGLLWSMNQSASQKKEAHTVSAQIAELNNVIADLRTELVVLNAELNMVEASSNKEFLSLKSQPIDDGQNTETIPEHDVEIILLEDAMSTTDKINEELLENTADPQQESGDMVDGSRELTNRNYDLAIKNFEKVETSAPEYIAARLGVANAYFYSQRFDKAITAFTFVLQQQADSVEALIGLANAHHRLDQREQQIAAYDKAISIEPEQWLHYNSRATAHLMDGNNEQASLDFQRATELAGPKKADQATALENIGLIYLREQQWSTAYEHAEQVNRLDAMHAWNWLIRGIAAAKLKRNVDAYVSFDKWFKYKKATDPYLLKQLLPEDIHAYVDATPLGLTKLVDPPKISGEVCDNDSQCKSYSCKPGAPLNKSNYCVQKDKVCSAPNSNGYLINELLEIDGMRVRCYQPKAGNARWTINSRIPN